MASAESFLKEKMVTTSRTYVFGGDKEWHESDWAPINDTVRGGMSTSFLKPRDNPSSAVFSGFLDVKTLGGAGFASQRTVSTEERDFTEYDGIELNIGKSDGKRYSLILKDEVLPKRPNGLERSSVNWEYEFLLPAAEEGEENTVTIRWNDFEPTYRGKPLEDFDRGLDVGKIQRISFMMRSFFGFQEGDYELEIKSIAVFKEESTEEQQEKELPRRSDPSMATRPPGKSGQKKRSFLVQSLFDCVLGCCVRPLTGRKNNK